MTTENTKFVQTKLSRYFSGVKCPPKENIKSRRNLKKNCNSFSTAEPKKMLKRKLPAPIFDEDNLDVPSPQTISVNRPKSQMNDVTNLHLSFSEDNILQDPFLQSNNFIASTQKPSTRNDELNDRNSNNSLSYNEDKTLPDSQQTDISVQDKAEIQERVKNKKNKSKQTQIEADFDPDATIIIPKHRNKIPTAETDTKDDSTVGDKITVTKNDQKDPFLDPQPSCSTSSPKNVNTSEEIWISLKKKKEEENVNSEKPKNELNLSLVQTMNEFIRFVTKSKNLSGLLSKNEQCLIKDFNNLSENYKYFLLKLFMWQSKYYNIFSFCQSLHLNTRMTSNEIIEMYLLLRNHQFVDTDYSKQDAYVLLKDLSLKDVRDICRKFKMKKVDLKKEDLIQKLLDNSITQATLTYEKSTTTILKERIMNKMGYCVKISVFLYDTFGKLYLLNTFADVKGLYITHQDYFYRFHELTLPSYKIHSYKIFNSIDDFNKYYEAVKMDVAYEKIQVEGKTKMEIDIAIYDICFTAFERLQFLTQNINSDKDSHLLGYHERFTAIYKYISILTKGYKRLTPSHHENVLSWISYMLELPYCQHKRYLWISQLTKIYTTYLKDYTSAAKLLIDALTNERASFSDYQLYELEFRVQILNKRTYKLDSLYHDQLLALIPETIERNWPTATVSCRTVRENNAGQKRRYVIETKFGRQFVKVEDVALEHYLTNGFTSGRHCEGQIVSALFRLLFWDIVYGNYAKGTFVSKGQTAPLDFHTKYFYANRKDAIERRKAQIDVRWSDEELKHYLIDAYNEHSGEFAINGEVSQVFSKSEELFDVVMCVGRSVISRILHRMAIDYGAYHTGFPDLMVWNVDKKKAKFVEVKGENDRMSIKQKLWMNFLMDIGADVELCHIHSTGSKRKIQL